MPIAKEVSRTEARKFTTQAEFALVEKSFNGSLSGLDLVTVRKSLARAQDLFRKHRETARRQKRTLEGTSARGTLLKAQIFKETAGRFRVIKEKLTAKASAARKKKPTKKTKSSRVISIARGDADTVQGKNISRIQKKYANLKTSRLRHAATIKQRTGIKRFQGHTAAQTRRRQARRDSK